MDFIPETATTNSELLWKYLMKLILNELFGIILMLNDI